MPSASLPRWSTRSDAKHGSWERRRLLSTNYHSACSWKSKATSNRFATSKASWQSNACERKQLPIHNSPSNTGKITAVSSKLAFLEECLQEEMRRSLLLIKSSSGKGTPHV